MWSEEKTKGQLEKINLAITASTARINSYDTEIAKLNNLKATELQEYLKLQGEIRLLEKMLSVGDKNDLPVQFLRSRHKRP